MDPSFHIKRVRSWTGVILPASMVTSFACKCCRLWCNLFLSGFKVPFFQYCCEKHFASTCEVRSPLVYFHRLIKFRSALYSIIMNDFELFSDTLITSMDEMIARQSFVNLLIPSTSGLLGSQILASISGVLFQYEIIAILRTLSDVQAQVSYSLQECNIHASTDYSHCQEATVVVRCLGSRNYERTAEIWNCV